MYVQSWAPNFRLHYLQGRVYAAKLKLLVNSSPTDPGKRDFWPNPPKKVFRAFLIIFFGFLGTWPRFLFSCLWLYAEAFLPDSGIVGDSIFINSDIKIADAKIAYFWQFLAKILKTQSHTRNFYACKFPESKADEILNHQGLVFILPISAHFQRYSSGHVTFIRMIFQGSGKFPIFMASLQHKITCIICVYQNWISEQSYSET